MSAPERAALNLPGLTDCIDVSACQWTIDYPKVAAAGFALATCKASEALTGADPTALAHINGFRSVGMLVTAYHFLTPSAGRPRDQVKFCYDHYGDIFLPRLVLDFEAAPAAMTAHQLCDFLEEAIEECEDLGGAEPITYSGGFFTPRFSGDPGAARLARSPLFLARYRSTVTPWAPSTFIGDWPKAPAPWTEVALWQYSGNGGFPVPGVGGDCDRGLFRGDALALKAFMGFPVAPADVPTLPSLPPDEG